MTRRRRRGLTAEELDLWEKVKARTTPLHPVTEVIGPAPVSKPVSSVAEPVRKLAKFQIGERRTQTAWPENAPVNLSDRSARPALRMDSKTFSRLRKGRLRPEARLDLHGKTLDRAHRDLFGFVLDAFARQLRLVLVITGKGRARDDDGPIPVRRGVLKHQVPHWLAGPGLSHAVLQVSEAHKKHGGGGAIYVYLRRRR